MAEQGEAVDYTGTAIRNWLTACCQRMGNGAHFGCCAAFCFPFRNLRFKKEE